MENKLDNKYHDMLNNGEIYDCQDKDLMTYQSTLIHKLFCFNHLGSTPEDMKKKDEILREIVGTYNEGLYIEAPISSNWGLHHVHFGKEVYINSNADFVDDADIYIGDHTMFGPNVTIVTANHPISPRYRKYKLEYNKPVHIGKNVWIGAGVIILSGLTIGDNTVIGAGSLVTHDIPADCIAYGNPCRVIRKITPEDDDIFDHGRKVPQAIKDKYK